MQAGNPGGQQLGVLLLFRNLLLCRSRFLRGFGKLDVGNMDGAFALDDRTIRLLLGATDVLLNHADTLDDDLVLVTVDLKDLSFGATVVSGDDLHEVTSVNVGFYELKRGHGWELLGC